MAGRFRPNILFHVHGETFDPDAVRRLAEEFNVLVFFLDPDIDEEELYEALRERVRKVSTAEHVEAIAPAFAERRIFEERGGPSVLRAVLAELSAVSGMYACDFLATTLELDERFSAEALEGEIRSIEDAGGPRFFSLRGEPHVPNNLCYT